MMRDAKKTTRGSASRTGWTNLALLAGILVVANVLGTDLFLRLDLTGSRIYSLSPASKTAVRELKDRLTIKAYFSEDLPAQLASQARFVKDKLDDYKAYSRGMIHYEFVDPGSEDALRDEASQYGIQPATVQAVERDKLEMKQVYLALVFLYEDRTETIPLVRSTQGLEYDITTAIRRVSTTDLPVVGFMAGHGMPDPNQKMTSWTRDLARHYQVRPITIQENQLVPPDVTILFIIGPTSGFDRWERYAIDQFIMRGGKTAWLLDMVNADLQQSQQGMAQPLDLGMDAWLMHYGIHVKTALVMDRSAQTIQVSQRQGFYQVQSLIAYPFFPKSGWFDRENPMVKGLPSLTFFYVSPVDTSLTVTDAMREASTDTLTAWPPAPPDVSVTPIVYSSPVSALQQEFFFIQPNAAMARTEFKGGPYPMAAVVEGAFRSAFDAAPAVPDSVTLPPLQIGPVENRLVVVGDGSFPTDDFAGVEGEAQFLLNMVDWLNQDEALIAIRSKEVDYRPIREVSAALRKALKWLDILLPPILAILLGLFWWRYRRNRQHVAADARTSEGR